MIPEMAKLFKRDESKFWQFWLNGIRQSTGCTDKKEAQIVALKVIAEHRNRKLLTFDPSIIPLEKAIAEYHSKRQDKEKATQDGDKLALKVLLEYYQTLGIKRLTLSHITKNNLEGWKVWMQEFKNYEAGGVNSHIRRVKGFFKTLVKWDFITDDPSKFLKQCKVVKKLVPLLSKEERQKLCDFAQKYPKLKYAIPIMFFTGIARKEITSNLNISEDSIFYIRKKTNKPVTVFISDLLRPYIQDLPLGINRIFKCQPRHFSRLFEKFFKDAQNEKITDQAITPHTIRHNFTVWYLQASNGDYESCAEILGHADHGVTILKNYSQYIPQRTRAVLNNI